MSENPVAATTQSQSTEQPNTAADTAPLNTTPRLEAAPCPPQPPTQSAQPTQRTQSEQAPVWPVVKAFLRDRTQRDRPTSHLRRDLQRLNAEKWPDTAENLIQQFDAGFEKLLVESGGNRVDPSLLDDQAKAKMRITGSGTRTDPTAEQGGDGVEVQGVKADLIRIAKRHRIPGWWLKSNDVTVSTQQETRCAACTHDYREFIDDQLRCGMSLRGLQGKLADILASPLSHETLRKHRRHAMGDTATIAAANAITSTTSATTTNGGRDE